MSREPKLVTDLRSLFSGHTDEQRSSISQELLNIACEFESQGLHYQANEPTAERYMKHARFFERLAEAIR